MVLAKPHGPDPPANSFLRSNRVKDRKIKKLEGCWQCPWPGLWQAHQNCTWPQRIQALGYQVGFVTPESSSWWTSEPKAVFSHQRRLSWRVHAQSCPTLLQTPWAVAHQAPLSMGFSCKNTGVGCQSLLQRLLPTSRLNQSLLHLLHWQSDSLPRCHLGSPYLGAVVSKHDCPLESPVRL